MARAKQNPKATTVRTTTTSRGVRTVSKSTMALLAASVLALAWAGVELTGAGGAMYAYGFFFTEFFAGVVALVSLSLTVMMGLLATDRLVLMIRHRVLLQSAHRATGILGVAGLVFHVTTKIAIGRAGPTDAVVPFVGGRGLYVGLGTVAAFLMVSVLWTGIIRVRFAGVGPKWLWRALHSLAYVSWPFALVHGLNAGRTAKSWVTLSYLACVLLVVVALMVRLSVHLGKRSREQHQAAALNQAMTVRVSDEGSGRSLLGGLGRRKSEAREEERSRSRDGGWAETTATSWSAPTGTARRRDPERFTVPVVPEPGTLREPVRAGRTRRDEEPEPVPRRRRDEDVAPVSAGRRSRRDDDDLVARYSVPPRLEEPEEPWDSPRRWEASLPVSAEPISATPRSGAGRHSVADDVPEEPDYWRPPARYLGDELPVDDTPTLVDLASRRALKANADSRRRRRRADADAVDGAYWAGLRGEAK
ncbi:hypothetical protein V6U81_07025 [Micromonospora sp. CPCC 205711]|uniref:ferric reductase-like transmembrane domain-containing protein n=1 Tax=Micromonospora sp. CPCC 205547 TaxID=3122400 RepID=UPI002FF1BCFF